MLLVAGVVTLVVLAFVIPLALLVRNVVYRDATNALQGEANQIASYVAGNLSSRVPTVAEVSSYLDGLHTEIRASVDFNDGTIVGQLPPGGEQSLPALPAFGDPHGGGAQPGPASYAGGKLVQLPVFGGEQSGPGRTVVRVYASDAELHSGETGWWLLLGGSGLALLLLGVGAAELLTRRLVRPLVHTAETAHRMSSGDVTARAPTDGPREIAEVGVALNRLGDRIDELIAEERETVADLSHRLRTPLTALRLDAEALRDAEESERVGGHVNALERMLTAVIHAARRPQREGRMPSCDATAVVGDRVAFWSALADDQGRAVEVSLPDGPVQVRAAAEDLGAAVDALLENVVAHTPEGTAFRVSLTPIAGGGAGLEVDDDGTGLPDDAEVRGRSDRGSTGLGLDIARRCAEVSGGSMTVGTAPSGGARVTLRLGPPPTTTQRG